MAIDIQYNNLNHGINQIEHKYGKNIYITSDPFGLTILSKLCHKDTVQPLVNSYIEMLYTGLLRDVINHSFPRVAAHIPTRMYEKYPEAVFHGEIIDSDIKVVSVNLARAGIFPSHLFYNLLNYLVKPENVRQDHFICNRITNEQGKVVGVDISGSKIGGGVDDSVVIFPDPMGATGGTICNAIDHYKKHVPGVPRRFIAVHLIITPEYIRTLKKRHPEAEIYAIRLDRGLSSEKVLSSIPGTFLEEERGLTDHQYIVPGGGGLGEILNNSFV